MARETVFDGDPCKAESRQGAIVDLRGRRRFAGNQGRKRIRRFLEFRNEGDELLLSFGPGLSLRLALDRAPTQSLTNALRAHQARGESIAPGLGSRRGVQFEESVGKVVIRRLANEQRDVPLADRARQREPRFESAHSFGERVELWQGEAIEQAPVRPAGGKQGLIRGDHQEMGPDH